MEKRSKREARKTKVKERWGRKTTKIKGKSGKETR